MSFFKELKRRNVIRVAIAYGVASWFILQLADVVLENIGSPGWVIQTIMLVLAAGFPMAIIFAWAFEMTPEGIKKEKDVDRSRSIASTTGRKLDRMIIGILTVTVAYLLIDKLVLQDSEMGPGYLGSESNSQSALSQSDNPVNENLTLTPNIKNNSIAVLPFANRSNVEEDMFFTDGIHDDLLTQLAKISDLKVISRTSVMKYKNTEKTIPEIAAELGVATILEGGIQRAGNRIRINAQLINVGTDEHIWAETFDREMTIENIFDIQSEITRQIVTAVKGELSEEESEVLSSMPTDSLAAYEAYLHARSILNLGEYSEKKFIEAEIWVRKALENDPEFALAWAMLVEIHGQIIWIGFDQSPERYQMVQDALSKASQYGPFLPETLAARAEYLYRIDNNFHEAEIAIRSASEAKPGDANLRARLAYTERRTGKWEQSVSSFQLAIELDPDNLQARTGLAETLINMGEYERLEPLVNAWIEKYPQALDIKSFKTAILTLGHGDLEAARNWHDQVEASSGNAYFNATLNLPWYERDYQAVIDTWSIPQFAAFTNQPVYRAFMLVNKSQAYMLAGNAGKAEELAQQALEEVLEFEPNNDSYNAQGLQTLALAYVLVGQTDKALENSEKALQLYPESRDSLNGVFLSSTHAWIMAMAGLRDEALAEIERLLNTPAGLERWDLYLNPQWDFFRDDERFNELIRPLNLKETTL